MKRFPVFLLFATFVGSASHTAMAQRAFGPVFEHDERRCQYRPLAGLSADGGSLAVVRRCRDTESGYAITDEVLLEHDFLSRAPIPDGDVGIVPAGLQFLPTDLSGDGRIVVGARYPMPNEEWRLQAGLADEAGVFRSLGFLPNDSPYFYGRSSDAAASSFDSSVVVGSSTDVDGRLRAVRWTEAGIEAFLPQASPPLGDWDFDPTESRAIDVSGDGEIIVGDHEGLAYLWNARDGLVRLTSPTDSEAVAQTATAISSNGRFVLGHGRVEGEAQPFLWSSENGLMGLSTPPSGVYSPGTGPLYMFAVSNDGRRAVGGAGPWNGGGGYDAAVLWTAEHGMVWLRDHLEGLGINTHRWQTFASAFALSDDGETLLVTGHELFEDSFDTKLLYARLRAPAQGVDLCEAVDPDCVRVEVVARRHQLVPNGRDSGYWDVYHDFDPPVINAAGGVAFRTDLISRWDLASGGFEPDSYDYTRTAVAGPSADGETVVRFYERTLVGEQPWNTNLRAYLGPRSLALGDDGSLVFNAQLSEPGVRDFVLARQSLGGEAPETLLRVRSGRDAAVESDRDVLGMVSLYYPIQLERSGHVSVFGTVDLDGDGDGRLWTGVLRADPDGGFAIGADIEAGAEGLDPALTIGGITRSVHDRGGRIAFEARLSGPGMDSNTSGLFAKDTTGRLRMILRDGQLIDWKGQPYRFERAADAGAPQMPSLLSRGRVAFLALLRSDIPEPHWQSIIWQWSARRGLSPRLLGDQLSSTLPPGSRYLWLMEPHANARGDLLVAALYSPPEPHGHGNVFWLHTARGQLVPLLRTGQQAPGLPDGVRLGSSNWNENTYDKRNNYTAISSTGDALLEFSLEGAGIDESNDRALYLVDRRGHSRLVLRTGQQIEIAWNDARTIRRFDVSWGFTREYGRQPLNASRQVAVRVEFVDDSTAVLRLQVERVLCRAGEVDSRDAGRNAKRDGELDPWRLDRCEASGIGG